MHGDSLLMLTTKVVSNKKPPLLSDSESGGSTSQDNIVTSVLIGASKPEQILMNLEAMNNIVFSSEELKLIDDNSL